MRTKLLVAVPTLDFVHSAFMECLIKLTKRLSLECVDFDVCIISGTLVYVARDRLANKAINEDFTHVLWLDSDMVFQPDIFRDLLDTGKDFVTGIYHARRPGHASCIFKRCDELDHIERFDKYPSDTFEIGGCGFGCVLIKTDILKAVKLNYKTCFLPKPQLGEDIAFCQRARAMGFKIWCEPSVQCGHIGHITVYPEDEERWRQGLYYPGEGDKNG